LDETALSHGELYTILTNKSAKGKQGAIVAIIAGTSSETVQEHLNKIPLNLRKKVEEITLDMAGSMNLIAKKCFPNAVLVTDRFHVQKLALEAVQELRIKHRWEAIDKENEAIEKARRNKKVYHPIILENGDTVKQLLARSRYVQTFMQLINYLNN
jgi:transposase